MTVLQFEIEDQIIHNLGIQKIKDFLNRQLTFLKATYMGDRISQVIQQSGFDHAKEVEESRQEAWEEYKNKNL
jgi:hypothetical protein